MSIKRKQAYLALLFNSIVWGAAFPVVKPALTILSSTQYLYFRFLVAGIVALPIFLYYYHKLRPKISYLIKVLLIESVQLIALLVLYYGLSQTSALEASLIGATGPLFIVLGGVFFLHERETKREWHGLLISLFGSLILVFEPIWNGHGFSGSSLSGNLLVITYNLLYMIYVVIAKKYYRQHPPLYTGSLIYFLAAAIYGIILLVQGALPSPMLLITSPQLLFPVLYMAIPGSIGAFAMYLFAASRIEVSEANLFTYLNGIVAIPAAYFLLGEIPSLTSLLAIIIIAGGVYRAQSKTRS